MGLVVSFLSSFFDPPAPPAAEPRPDRALLVGVNYIAGSENSQLRGCANDVLTMWRVLSRDNVQCVVLCDDEPDEGWPDGMDPGSPTRQNMVDEMTALAVWSHQRRRARCWFHFSGHGGQAPDRDGDEQDGLDECLFPADYASAGVIRDDLLALQLRRSLAEDATLVAIIDACHSGTMLDLPHAVGSSSDESRGAACISISGCRDDQTSADALMGEKKAWGGALTRTLAPLLAQGERRCGPLQAALHQRLRLERFSQRPEVRGSAPLAAGSRLHERLSSRASG